MCKSIHSDRFAHESIFAYMQIFAHICKSGRGLRERPLPLKRVAGDGVGVGVVTSWNKRGIVLRKEGLSERPGRKRGSFGAVQAVKCGFSAARTRTGQIWECPSRGSRWGA